MIKSTKHTGRNKQLKRWVLTINNPIWDSEKDVEVDLANNTLPILENYYDLLVVKDEFNRDLFHFKYIEVTTSKDGKVVVERPYFKDYESIKTYMENLEHFKYAVYQLEQGKNETPHIQAGIIFEAGKRFYTVKKYFPTAHIEPARGSNTDIRAYCMKSEGKLKEPVEIGKFSEMRSRNDIVEFLELVKLGATDAELQSLFPVLFTQYGIDKIEKFRQVNLKAIYENTMRAVKATYIYGAARLGKTSYIFQKYAMKDVCRVVSYGSGAFDNYKSQKVLVLDEFTGKLDITLMNNILDNYPFELPARFANRTACYDTVYIVSNLKLSQLYTNAQHQYPEIYNSFVKRIKNVIRFTGLGEWRFEMRDERRTVDGLEQIHCEGLPFPQIKRTKSCPTANNRLTLSVGLKSLRGNYLSRQIKKTSLAFYRRTCY